MIDPQTEQALRNEGFEHLNPALAVWRPELGDSVRGYLLARQLDRDKHAFLVVQLTRPYDDAPPGTLVVVYEVPSLSGAERFQPQYQTVRPADGPSQMVAVSAFELVIHATGPFSKATGPTLQLYARRVPAQLAQPPIAPPPAPCVLPTLELAEVTAQHAEAAELRAVPPPAETPAPGAPPNGA